MNDETPNPAAGGLESSVKEPLDIRHHFDEQLEGVRVRLVDLGTLALTNIRRAGETVLTNSLDQVERVREADQPINEEYARLEQEVFHILARQQPYANDLRFLVASTRILYEIERCGDLAVNIVNALERINGTPAEPAIDGLLEQLVESSTKMFALGIEAIATMDEQIGLSAEASDEETDRIQADLFKAITARQTSLGLEAAVALFYIGRFFERIADHGVNIAQNITFVQTAHFPPDDPDHGSPEG